MKYSIFKKERIPNKFIYENILTLILAFAIIWIIYISIPYTHYSLYLIETKK
jgi:TM2 domain-containing membrane protein YozV